MSDERAERLREVIERAEANVHPPYPDWSADMPTRVLRAIVSELGITREMVREIQRTPSLCDDPACLQCGAPRALATLLDAAGIEP